MLHMMFLIPVYGVVGRLEVDEQLSVFLKDLPKSYHLGGGGFASLGGDSPPVENRWRRS